MTDETLDKMLQAMLELAKQPRVVNNNYGTIGEQIEHVDTIVNHWDKGAGMQVKHAERVENVTAEAANGATGDVGAPACGGPMREGLVQVREGGGPMREGYQPMATAPDGVELCHLIHPGVTEYADQLRIHREVVNLVRDKSVSEICEYLEQMVEAQSILLPIMPEKALAELQRLGMPGEEVRGFSKKNFYKYYRN